jgi:uncharacterized membrane protein YesL
VDDKNLPVLNSKTYVKETALALWDILPRLLLASFLFFLVCLPSLLPFLFENLELAIMVGIVTVAPGWTAITAVLVRALLRETASIADFFKAFGHFYLRGSLLGLIWALPLLSASLLLPALATSPVPTPVWVGLGTDAAGIFLLGALSIYTYPQLAIYDVGVGLALKNSMVLVMHYLSNTIGLLAMAFLLALLATQVSYFLLLILPACWMVFVINNCRMVLRIELGDSNTPNDSQDPE